MELELYEIYEPNTLPEEQLGYIGIVALYKSQWVIVRLEGTKTWEFPGGAIDEGETPLEAAKRELFEETGATKSKLTIIGQYSIKSGDITTYGNLYFADIIDIGPLPEYEIVEVLFVNDFPIESTRHPNVIPKLFAFSKERIKLLGFTCP